MITIVLFFINIFKVYSKRIRSKKDIKNGQNCREKCWVLHKRDESCPNIHEKTKFLFIDTRKVVCR